MAGVTFDERVAALRPLGLGPRQTAFLALVALHGGYCVRRQFDTFVGRVHGAVGRAFFATLAARKLATTIRYRRHRGLIYHVQPKSLYRALDQVANRNRRLVSPALIARKLMVLDYVLTAPPSEWLATEADKVAWFTTQAAISPVDLPQRSYHARSPTTPLATRYFVHKLPIRVTAPGAPVEFVHLVVDETGRHFRRFLEDHTRLLTRLPAWMITLVCPHHLPEGPARCERVFHETFLRSAPPRHVGTADLSWFFRTRVAIDRGDFDALTAKDLDRFRNLRDSLTSASVERLYLEWQRRGEVALTTAGGSELRADAVHRVRTYRVPSRYEQFGALPGLV
jgi:hypothetical protein